MSKEDTRQRIVRERIREMIVSFLPEALDRALISYHAFAAKKMPEDAQGFSDHHKACKIAIGNIELLLKLAAHLNLPDYGKQSEAQELAALIEDAKKDVQSYYAALKKKKSE